MEESAQNYSLILTGKSIPNRKEIEELVEEAIGNMDLTPYMVVSGEITGKPVNVYVADKGSNHEWPVYIGYSRRCREKVDSITALEAESISLEAVE